MEIIIKNIKYNLDIENKTARVIGYNKKLCEVILPEFINYAEVEYKVTSIGDSAFKGCKKLTSIIIPDSVTSIGDWAFYRCDNLISIKIPDSVTSIGECVFNCCWSLPSIVIPENVTEIGDRMFRNCRKLTSITFSDNITSIGRYAFCSVGVKLPKRYTEDGRLIAYKGFNANMMCKEFQYEEGKTYEIGDEIKICNCDFYAYTNPLDVFNQTGGRIGKDIFIHEVYLSGEIDDVNEYESMVRASRIEIGRVLGIKELKIIINK